MNQKSRPSTPRRSKPPTGKSPRNSRSGASKRNQSGHKSGRKGSESGPPRRDRPAKPYRSSSDARPQRTERGRPHNRRRQDRSRGRGNERDRDRNRSRTSGDPSRRPYRQDRYEVRSRDGARTEREQQRPERRVRQDSPLAFWIKSDLLRHSSGRARVQLFESVESGIQAFEQGRYRPAMSHFLQAKELATRSSVVRYWVGLVAYHLEEWKTALGELRAYRRLSGSTELIPLEMDCLRGLKRTGDVERLWLQAETLPIDKPVSEELKVVYASFLMDQNRVSEAKRIVGRFRPSQGPSLALLRKWYVQAKVAIRTGDTDQARQIVDTITKYAPDMGGMEELLDELSSSTIAS